MLTDAFLNFILAVANFFWGLLPSWDLQPSPSDVDAARGYIAGVDWFFPAHELLAAVVFVGSTFVIVLALWAGLWCFRRIVDVIP